ncbi:PLD nuclease N-terminal domain-containing protein [Glutamicibacter sp.]|uniref:PLD nuclease N-terminal domain-containing protein n=1 Tax=Glutamicibacter sp. TaxID=1931995 RepID=UPI0028BE222F|nr:PLD nuclease N-terminal domain-containing protein [Glutamicibacter sp.]
MAKAKKKKFSELSPIAQAGIITAATAQITLFLAAQIDLIRRKSDQVRGRKAVWAGVNFINTFGPLSYFIFGRKSGKH